MELTILVFMHILCRQYGDNYAQNNSKRIKGSKDTAPTNENHRRQKRLSAPVSMRIARFQLNPRDEINMAITISAAMLDLCLRKTRADKSRVYRDVIVFRKAQFRPH